MKKFLLGCLMLMTACQSATTTPAPESTPTITVQTPSPTATATATATSVPTLSPTPVPAYFTQEFDSTLDGWTSFITSGDATPQVALDNGSMKLIFSSPHTWYYALHPVHDYEAVHLDAKFSSTGNQPVSAGLICNYSETDGWFEYNISTDGTYSILIGKWLGNGVAQYTPIVTDSSEYLTRDRTDYEIGLTCEPDVLWLYIDGRLFRKINVSHYELKEGKVGLAAAVFQNAPVTAYFEWFRVSEPGN